ncbi:MAG: DUF1801 domain-containing protein [Candidatus Delongbacteria bacterium]
MTAATAPISPVDVYLATFPPEIQARLAALRAVIRAAAPEAVEGMAYGIPTYKGRKNLVHFAGYAGHVGFYPGAVGIAAFREELAGYKSAKGSMQFPHNQPLPLELVRRITEFRVRQDREQA